MKTLLSSGANLSQIFMLVLVCYGYFYTVIPIYQKEKLAEEVVKLQNEIDQQKINLILAKKMLKPLLEEKKNISNTLEKLKVDLDKTKKLKQAMEDKISFMDYKYYLPDGTPAKSDKQIQEVFKIKKQQRLERSRDNYIFLFKISFMSWSNDKANNVFVSRYLDVDDSFNTYPFTKDEYEIITSEKGIEYFLKNQSLKILDSYHNSVVADSPKTDHMSLNHWRLELEVLIKNNPIKWKVAQNLSIIPEEYKKMKGELDIAEKLELAKIDDEFDGWESTWGASKREILRHNYSTSKGNTIRKYKGKRMELKYDYNAIAEKIRKDIKNEIGMIIELEKASSK